MDLGIAGKTAIVAAASKGLGEATAFGLAREGANVVICARDKIALAKAAEKISAATSAKVLPVVADVTSLDDIERVVEAAVGEFDRIDILVTNAGGPPSGLFRDFSNEDWLKAVNLNLMSTISFCRVVIPYLKVAGVGRIVNIVSIAAKQPIPGLILSNSVRAAVIGLAKTLADELAPDKILVNSVCPGWILTDRMSEVLQRQSKSERVPYQTALNRITETIPLGRCGTAAEIADLIVFLASERASYITGATIQVDGGLCRGLF
jgi:3-oxoacyl-[acyl-carrier protein] reductase